MEHDAARLFATAVIFLVTAIVLVSARLYTRYLAGQQATGPVSSNGLGVDDWLILLSLCLAAFGTLVICVATSGYALGRGASQQTPWNIQKTLFLIWMDQIAYLFVATLTKLSTLSLYIRLVGPSIQKRNFRWTCWIVGVLLILVTSIMVIAIVFACSPPSYFWTRPIDLINGVTTKVCRNQRAYWYFTVGLSVGSDLIVILLPVRIVKNIQMNQRKKWTIVGLFGLGGLITISSIARGTTIEKALRPRASPVGSGVVNLCLWSLIESHGGIICACIPTLSGPFSQWYEERVRPTTSTWFNQNAFRRTLREDSGEPPNSAKGLPPPVATTIRHDDIDRSRSNCARSNELLARHVEPIPEVERSQNVKIERVERVERADHFKGTYPAWI